MISSDSQGGPNIAVITIACGWTFAGIASLGVGLLIWSRRVRKLALGLDDYLTFLALATTIALVVQTTWAIVAEGLDNHEAEVKRTKFAWVVRSLIINQTLWGVVNTLIRMSAILFIRSIFKPKIDKLILLLLLLSILYGLVVLLEIFLICRPMAVDWDANVDGKCGDQTKSYLVLEILGLLLDAITLAVPFPCIWRLPMELGRKVSLFIIFSIGVLVFIITGLRIQALCMVTARDFIYSKGYLGLLSTLGASLGIIIICAPSVVGLYRGLREVSRERKLRVAQINLENAATGSKESNEIAIPIPNDNAALTHVISGRWSMDGYVAGARPAHSYRLQRYRTF